MCRVFWTWHSFTLLAVDFFFSHNVSAQTPLDIAALILWAFWPQMISDTLLCCDSLCFTYISEACFFSSFYCPVVFWHLMLSAMNKDICFSCTVWFEMCLSSYSDTFAISTGIKNVKTFLSGLSVYVTLLTLLDNINHWIWIFYDNHDLRMWNIYITQTALRIWRDHCRCFSYVLQPFHLLNQLLFNEKSTQRRDMLRFTVDYGLWIRPRRTGRRSSFLMSPTFRFAKLIVIRWLDRGLEMSTSPTPTSTFGGGSVMIWRCHIQENFLPSTLSVSPNSEDWFFSPAGQVSMPPS